MKDSKWDDGFLSITPCAESAGMIMRCQGNMFMFIDEAIVTEMPGAAASNKKHINTSKQQNSFLKYVYFIDKISI